MLIILGINAIINVVQSYNVDINAKKNVESVKLSFSIQYVNKNVVEFLCVVTNAKKSAARNACNAQRNVKLLAFIPSVK